MEYTNMVNSNKDFLQKLEEIRDEIVNDPSPGVPWKELLSNDSLATEKLSWIKKMRVIIDRMRGSLNERSTLPE